MSYLAFNAPTKINSWHQNARWCTALSTSRSSEIVEGDKLQASLHLSQSLSSDEDQDNYADDNRTIVLKWNIENEPYTKYYRSY